MHELFDLDLVATRRARAAAAAVPGADFLMARIAEDLLERMSTLSRRFPDAGVILPRSGHARDALLASGRVDHVLDAPVRPDADHENLKLQAECLDLAVSLLSLQDANDLPGLLVQARRALRPDGLFLGCLAGQGTLAELRDSLLAAETELTGGASPRVHPFADVKDVGALLQRAGFALPVADVEPVVVRYDSLFGLMRDLKAMGATTALAQRSRRPAGRRLFMRAAEIYAERHADGDGRIRATFQINWLSGWAPHESQQKPLKPGSAEISLAKILGGKD